LGIGDIAVVDAGPVIHLFEIGALDLLAGWRQLLMPETVWEETVAVRRVTAQAIDDLDNVYVVGGDKSEAENRLRSLHRVSSLFVTYELIEFAIRQLT